jgi:hypothetical protein
MGMEFEFKFEGEVEDSRRRSGYSKLNTIINREVREIEN